MLKYKIIFAATRNVFSARLFSKLKSLLGFVKINLLTYRSKSLFKDSEGYFNHSSCTDVII